MMSMSRKVIWGLLVSLAVGGALSEGQVLLGGALSLLARQAGYTPVLELSPGDILRPVTLPDNTRGKEEETVRNLLEEVAPGKYEVLLEGKVLTVRPKEVRTVPARLVLLGPGTLGESLEIPEIAASAVVQEQVQATDELSLTLNPGEITCVEAAGNAVCLRPFAFAGEGEVAVELAGRTLKVHYRIEAGPPVLRRVSLDGSYASLKVRAAGSPIPSVLPPSSTPALPGGRWALTEKAPASPGVILWEGFRLEGVRGGSWVTPGRTCVKERVVRFLSAARGAGVKAGVEAVNGSCYRLFVKDSPAGKTLLNRLGLSSVELR